MDGELMNVIVQTDVGSSRALRPRGYAVIDTVCHEPTAFLTLPADGDQWDASELLRKVKAAQYVASHPGQVCPAKWQEGAATLTPSLDLVGKI